MLLEHVVAATCAHRGARACDIVTNEPFMPHGDCICDAACVAKKTREQSADNFPSTFQHLLASVWKEPVGWLRFKLQTDPADASKATIEEMHQRAVDTR